MMKTQLKRVLGITFVLGMALLTARAEDGDAMKQLADKGVTITESKTAGTTVTIKECSKLTEADFKSIGKIQHVKSLSFGLGLTDATLALLSELNDVESLSTNGALVSDEGLKALGHMQKLKSLAFFHPGPNMSGTGLSVLADAPGLERLTVAGSEKFGDAGMAAVAKLTQLKEFRTWHAGVTIEGVKSLKTLKALKSINVGQRLAYKPPVSVSNETVAALVEMTSLESIQLGEARLSLPALSQLKALPNLKKLTLDGIDVPKADLEALKKELPKVDIKHTEPNEAYMKRIQSLFGKE
ncbi:MAG: hypothetical protein WCT04_14410 [Planctomycetota bacterium]